jgi:hypothetical protein
MSVRSGLAAVVLVAALGTTGCFRHVYSYPAAPEPRASTWQWHHHLLWGLVNVAPSVHLERICPQGVAHIENWMGPGQAILSYLTLGIYTPTTVRVYCAAVPPAAASSSGSEPDGPVVSDM